MLIEFLLQTNQRNQFIDITKKIDKEIVKNNFKNWSCIVYTTHTTCGITINEWFDPDVLDDINSFLDNKIWENPIYKHSEWNSDSHIKSSLIWVSQQLIISEWKLLLWTWQKVIFCEFDWPRQRKCFLKIV